MITHQVQELDARSQRRRWRFARGSARLLGQVRRRPGIGWLIADGQYRLVSVHKKSAKWQAFIAFAQYKALLGRSCAGPECRY